MIFLENHSKWDQSKIEYLNSREEKAFCIVTDQELDGAVISFWDILFDERFAEQAMAVDEDHYIQAGGINELLGSGRYYECMLRIAEKVDFICVYQKKNDNEISQQVEDWKTDCYIASRYSTILQQEGKFDLIVENLLQQFENHEDAKERLQYLEDMLKKEKEYHRLYRQTQPILIIKGEEFCYNILNMFAEMLQQALEKKNILIETCELKGRGKQALQDIIGREYRAVIGFQSPLLGMKIGADYLYDLVEGPKLEMLTDAPFWFNSVLKEKQKDLYILTHDQNYQRFVQKYYPNVKGCYLLSPGGSEGSVPLQQEREYDCIFLGTYNNYREKLAAMYRADSKMRHAAAVYIQLLKENVEKDAAEVFQMLDHKLGYGLTEEYLPENMKLLSDALQCVMYYYREKIIGTIIQAGIELHVYGESWKKSPFAANNNLVIHAEIPAQKSNEELEKAKISINVMAWHKAGMTERIINSMLNGAVVISDKSERFQQEFVNGRDMFWYGIKELDCLPDLINELLGNEKKREKIQKSVYKIAKECYKWDRQADKLIRILQQL